MGPADNERAGRGTRVGFIVLALGQGIAAVWALTAPRSFYDDFPGGGHSWVAAHPPYNEHLTLDYASGAFALTVLAVLAAVSLHRRVVQVSAIAWLCFGLPHFVYHLITWERLAAGDAAANVITLSGTVLIPLAVLAGLRERPAGRAVPGRVTS